MLKKVLQVSILASLFLVATSSGVSAQNVNDFRVTDFNATYELKNNGHQGELRVKESITVDFSGYNHGILRALPTRYNGQSLHLKVLGITDSQGNSVQSSSSMQNGNKVLKIGDPNQTVTGQHTYVVAYTEQNVIRFKDGHTYLTINANGDQWQQYFDTVSMNVRLPDSVRASQTNCYVGVYGATTNECSLEIDDHVITAVAHSVTPGQTMTIDLRLNDGVFAAPTYKDWLRENGIFLASGVMLLIVPSLIGYRKWRANGKDIGGRGTIIPEYTPPKDLTVLEASTVQSYRVDTKALSATIIDLAIRGYITIHETEKKKILGLGGGQSYSFELINTDKSTLKTHETRILDSLFPTYEEGQYAEIGDTSTAMTTSYTFISTDIPERLTNAGYFTENPKKVGTSMVILGVIALIGGFVLLGVMAGLVMSPIAALPGIGLLCSGILLLTFGVLMPKRTQLGEDTADRLKGLKLFIETTEADRIKMMQSPNAPYANKTAEPHKIVELFETLLPYAMIFGIEKQWAKQFEKLYTQQPDWYDGNFSTFSTVYLVSALSSASTTMQSSFAPASSSGSGGGGGFSGGGSGGGGGGGW